MSEVKIDVAALSKHWAAEFAERVAKALEVLKPVDEEPRPRFRRWRDRDGDIWHEAGDGLLESGDSAWHWDDAEERFGPLVEVDENGITIDDDGGPEPEDDGLPLSERPREEGRKRDERIEALEERLERAEKSIRDLEAWAGRTSLRIEELVTLERIGRPTLPKPGWPNQQPPFGGSWRQVTSESPLHYWTTDLPSNPNEQ